MYLNDKEKAILDVFLGNLVEFEDCEMLLKWDEENQAKALFDTCFEDEDENENDIEYEEYISFMFKKTDIKGDPPIEIDDDYFIINYRNFPNEIIVNERKIN